MIVFHARIMTHLWQVIIENTSPTQEWSDYTLTEDVTTNHDGLGLFADGQPLAQGVDFQTLGYGQYAVIVEIHRGPVKYVYEPVLLQFMSDCDFRKLAVFLPLTVSWVQPCARAEFHHQFTGFHVTAAQFEF